MRKMGFRREIAAALLAVLSFESVAWAVDSKGAAYYGGTAPEFTGATDPLEGILNVRDEKVLVLTVTKGKQFRGEALTIPYERIIDLEYGQKAGRRVGAAVATTVLLGPIGLLTLFSKKRKHYLTIGYRGEADKEQVAVIELGKDIVRLTLPVLETRSGKTIAYQDDEARNSANK